MNKERLKRHALRALAIIALVLVTNEGYRHARALWDNVNQSKTDIAKIKRDLYVLQVQLDNQPAPIRTLGTTSPVPMPLPFPMMPSVMGQETSGVDPTPKSQTKSPTGVEPKSLINVSLMGDPKLSTPGQSASVANPKPLEGVKINVQLIGDSK